MPTHRDFRLSPTGFGNAGLPFDWGRVANLVSRYDAVSVKSRTAADFDGSSYLTLVDNASLDHSGSVSCWAWFQRSEVGATGRVLLGKWGANGEYVLELNTDNSKAQFRVHDGTGEVIATASTLVNVGGKFWFVCGTANASEVKVYVGDQNGGALVTATASPAAGVRTTADNFYLGTKNAGTWNYQGEMSFPGLVHAKLSDTQVDYLYNSGAGRNYEDLDDVPSASVVAKSDLIGMWPMGEDSADRYDISGNGNHVAGTGDVTASDGFFENTPDPLNKAGRFFRTTPSYYEVTGVPALNTTGTLAVWFRPTSATSDYTIFSVSEVGFSDNFLSLRWLGVTDTLQLRMNDNGGGLETADKASVGMVLNQWNHVALVANGDTNGYNIYLNGSDVGALAGLDTGKWLSVFTDLDTTNIGAEHLVSVGVGLTGDLDEVMLFNSALSAVEIADLAEGDTVDQLADTYPAIHAKLDNAWNLENSYFAKDLIGSLDMAASGVLTASPIIKAGDDRGVVFRASDLAGSNDLTQVDIADRPVHVITRNGKTALRFPIETDTASLRTGTLSDIAAPFTGYIVFKPFAVTSGGVRTYMYLENSGSDALGSLVLLATGVVRWRNDFFVQLESSSPVSATVPTICFFNCAVGGAGELYINGGTPVTGTVGANPVQAICLGGRFDDINPAHGDIYEAALFTGQMGASDMNAIGRQAASKYGGTWTDV